MKDDREETEEIDDEQSLGVNIATRVSQTGKVSVTVSVTVIDLQAYYDLNTQTAFEQFIERWIKD